MSVAKVHQHLFGGGVLSAFGFLGFIVDFEFVEKNLAHLHGRCGVELFAGEFKALLLEAVHTLGEHHRIVGERSHVDACAGVLHVGKHLNERQFDVGEQRCQTVGIDAGDKRFSQRERHIGELAGIGSDGVARHLDKALAVATFCAEQGFVGGACHAQNLLGEACSGVWTFGLQQIVSHGSVEVRRSEVDASTAQNHHGAFYVARHQCHGGAFEQRLQQFHERSIGVEC